MIGFKAFDKGLVCRGFQYEVGKTYEEENVSLCNKGFHYCENPFDVLDYYPLVGSEFAQVEAVPVETDGKKSVTNKIKITDKLELPDFIKASFNFLWEQNEAKDIYCNHNSQLAASGYSSQLASSGDYSQLASSGNYSQLAASGNYSQLEVRGEKSVAANIGVKGKIKAVIGTWITLAEYDGQGIVKCVKSAQVDGDKIKADTWYYLKNGEFTEVSNDN